MKLAASILATLLIATTSASAATIKRVEDRLVLTGPIQAGDDVAFAAALDGDVKIVVLGSTGGRVSEAMAIGRAIRKRRLDTAVPSSCKSACALIWAGGVKRTVEGRLAMHCPTFPGQLQCYAPTRQVMVDYLKEMGAPKTVIELQEAAGSTSSLWVEPAQLLTEAAQPIADEGPPPEEDYPPPPPRRRPPPRYNGPAPYAPPPGWIVIPSEQRAMPCLPTLLTFGVLRFCI